MTDLRAAAAADAADAGAADAGAAGDPADASAPEQPRRAGRRGWLLLGLVLLAANACVASGLRFPVIIPGLGLFLLVGLPTVLLMIKVDWHTPSAAERLGCSLVTTLLLLMSGGLLLNLVLPPLGITDALGSIPVLLLGDALVAGLLAWRRGIIAWRPARGLRAFRLTIGEKAVTRLSVASVALAAIGANRLNNGAGDSVTMVMLGLAFLTLVLVFLWRDRLDPGVITFVLCALGLALLLMTSMRGWYTTGHDIQREYRVFELTKTNGNWSISRFRDAYNACLSITILPTMLWDVTKIHDPYVYKVLFQPMFALCPALVYRLSLRFTTPAISLIGVTYLLCFPTYSNDMPFLNRQEIAFLFILAILLVLTNEAMPVRQRRLWIAAFSLGLIVSHYSSAAVFIATVLALAGLRLALRLGGSWLKRAGGRLHLPQTSLDGGRPRPVFGLLNIGVLVLAGVLWIGVITQTGSTISSTFSSAVSSIGQTFSLSAKSSDVAYNLFSFSQPSNAQLLREYRQQTIEQTGNRQAFYPLAAIDVRAPTRAVDITAPPSALGRDLSRAGINVTTIITVIRGGAAKLLQLLVLIGLIAALFCRDARFRIRREPYLFAVATLLMLVAEVIVPVVSENYGILRAFTQGLLILSPVLAYGSVVIFARLGRRWATRAAIGLALFLFAALSGLVPQLFGGYQQQLSLNNAGLYYDIYYPHTQEIAGVNWLRAHVPPALQTTVQSEVVTDEFEFQRLRTFAGVNSINDIYPTLLRRDSYVFLGYTTVHQDLAPISYKGNLVVYRYPTGYLGHVKNLLFDDGGARVYR
jgi:uncharacterized membrane protein